jgi:hypothetical protein
LWARIAAWALAAGLLSVGLRRLSSPVRTMAALAACALALVGLAAAALLRARSALRVLAGAAAVLLVAGLLLERWPTSRTAPAPNRSLAVDASTRVLFEGAVRMRGEDAILGPGAVTLLVRMAAPGATPPPSLRAVVGGDGVFQAAGRPPFALRSTGGLVDLPLVAYHEVAGRDGRTAAFARARVAVSGQAVLRVAGGEGAVLAPADAPVTVPGDAGSDPPE